jgi:hypothetical protein
MLDVDEGMARGWTRDEVTDDELSIEAEEGAHGGFGDAFEPAVDAFERRHENRKWAQFGPVPSQVERASWVAKFNPDAGGESAGEALDFPWEDPDEARRPNGDWISTEPDRTTSHPLGSGHWWNLAEHVDQVAPGDFVFFMRSTQAPPLGADDAMPKETLGIPNQAVVGLTVVTRVLAYPHWQPEVTCRRLLTAPLRLFDRPVRVNSNTRARASRWLKDAPAFADPNRAFMGLSAQQALALAATCGLPADIFTMRHIAGLAGRLRDIYLGPSKESIDRLLKGVEQAKVNRDIGKEGEDAAQRQLSGQFKVDSVAHQRGHGYDLRARAKLPDAMADRLVEVKSTENTALSLAQVGQRLTQNECDCALADERWWSARVTRARDPSERTVEFDPAKTLRPYIPTTSKTQDPSKARPLTPPNSGG